MIVANLDRVQPLAAGERKPRNYNAATLEFIPLPAASLLLRNLFLKLMSLIQLKYFSRSRIDPRIFVKT